jgi:hypothetical protein
MPGRFARAWAAAGSGSLRSDSAGPRGWMLGQLPACLRHWDTGSGGGGADVGDGCEQGVLPEVVGLPPGNLVEQVRLGSAAQRRRAQDGELELAILPAAEGALRQKLVPYPLQRQRVGPAGLAPVERISGEAEEYLAGKVLFGRCNGANSLSRPKRSGSWPSPSSRIRWAVTASCGVGCFRAGIPRQ